MSAQNNLSQQLFHGSGVSFKPGDIIKPVNHRVAHATTSTWMAHAYAESDLDPRTSRGNQPSLMSMVYTVEPVDAHEMASTTNAETAARKNENDENVMATHDMRFSKKGFKVTGVHSFVHDPYTLGVYNKRKRQEKDAENEARWEEAVAKVNKAKGAK